MSTGFCYARCCLRLAFLSSKGEVMELPSILQGDSLTRLLQGAAAGAAVTMIIGFN